MRTSPTGWSRRADPQGFTLLELSLVLLIVSLFFYLATVRLEGAVSGGDMALASRIIIGEVARLRGKAAYTRADQFLVFDIDENVFYATGPEREEKPLLEEEKLPEPPKERELPKGVALQDVFTVGKGKTQEGKAVIRFYANGCVEKALIHLRNERDSAHTLEISPLTGQVLIHDRYIEQKTK